jgi:membrane protease YdiL (CAAX protease family)
MRAFGWFFGTLLAAGLVTALIAYPVYELTSQFAPWPFHRVASRIAMLAAAGGLAWLCRHLGITSKRALGYGVPWRRFVRVAVISGLAGMATAAVGAWVLLAAHWRVPAGAHSVLKLLLVGLSSGIAVALIEETVMRGAMHTAIARESGPWAAVLLTAPLFAVLHFFAKARIPVEQLHWASGFDLIARSFAPLGTPALVLDSFMAWLAVSLVLSLCRVLTGNIAVSLGLHAGWVVVLRMLQESTARGPGASAWVGAFDGLLGYWLVPWCAAIGAALWLTRGAWAPYASGTDGGAPVVPGGGDDGDDGDDADDGASGAMASSPSRRSMGSSISK